MSEFNEPWKVESECDQHGCQDGVRIYASPTVHDASPWIADLGHAGAEDRISIADRIVACLNACAGIPTEQLSKKAGEFAPLVWRKEPPDRHGWWFWKKKNDKEPVVLEIMQMASGKLLVSWWDSDRELTEPMFAESLWAGPIEQPEVGES